MSFTREEENGLNSLFDVDIAELLVQGYTEEDIRQVMGNGLQQEQPTMTNTTPIEEEPIDLPSPPPVEQPQDYFPGLEIDVNQLINQGYTMDDINSVSKQFSPPPVDSPEGIADSVINESVQGITNVLGETETVLNTTDEIGKKFGIDSVIKNIPIGNANVGDLYNNIKNNFIDMYQGLGGYGAEKLGEFTDSEGMYKWGRDLQYGEGGSEESIKQNLDQMTEGGKQTLGQTYIDPSVEQYGNKLLDYIMEGKEIKKEDFPEKFWGSFTGEKILMDVTGSISSAPLMMGGLGMTKVLEKFGLTGFLGKALGMGAPFAVTEGLSVGKNINSLVDKMAHDDLYSAPLSQSIDSVIKEKFPDASPIDREKFIRKQLGNQLAFEYGGYASVFSLITDGGIGAMALKKIRGEVTEASASSLAKRTFMKRVGNVGIIGSQQFLQEFGQEGLNKLLENFASFDAGKDVGTFTGVPNAAMGGGVGGSGQGVIMGTAIEMIEGRRANREEENTKKIDEAIKEEETLVEESVDLPDGVRNTNSPGVWQQDGLDEEGNSIELLIGEAPKIVDGEEVGTIFKVMIPGMNRKDGEAVGVDIEFGSLQEASDFINNIGKNDETIEDVQTENEEEPTVTTEDEQTNVEDVDENIDEELVDEEDDPTIPIDIDDENIDEEITEEEIVSDTDAITDLKARKLELLDDIDLARQLDPQSVPIYEEELLEVQDEIDELNAIGITGDRGRADEEVGRRPVDIELEEAEQALKEFEENTPFTDISFPGEKQKEHTALVDRRIKAQNDIARANAISDKLKKDYEDSEETDEGIETEPEEGKVTSAGEMIDGRKQVEFDGLNLDFRNDGSTIIITDKETGQILGDVQVNEAGKFKKVNKSGAGKKAGKRLTRALKEAGKISKQDHENKPQASGKSEGKKTKVFHGGSQTGKGLFYVSEDKSEAGLYGEDVVEYEIDEDTIIDDDMAREILIDIGANVTMDDGMLMEFLDINFPDYYIGNKNVLKFRKEMIKRGYTGVRFTDNTANEGKTNSVTNIVLIDRPKAKVKDDKPQGKEELPKRPFSKLTIRSPWDSLIVDGEKTLETRGQPLPEKHIGKTLVLKNEKHEAVGEVVFSGSREIKSQEEFDSLEGQHRVGKDSQFGFGSRKRTYVWEVESYKKYDTPQKLDPMKGQTPIQPQASGKPKGNPKNKKKPIKPDQGESESRKSPLHKLEGMLLPADQVIKKSDIIKWFQKTFKKRIKPFGSIMMKDAGGLFYPRSESVRIKNPNDIEVASHEMAHWLETEIDRAFKKEGGVTINGRKYEERKAKVGRALWMNAGRKVLTPKMQEELQLLDYDQTKQRNFEGFAEYFRLLLSGHDMTKQAPEFHKFFFEKLIGNEQVKEHFRKEFGIDLIEKIDEAKGLFTKWYSQGSLNRAFAHSGMIKEEKPALSKIRAVWEKFENIMFREYDELHILEMKVKEINKVRERNGLNKLRPAKDPFLLATSEKLSHQKIANTLINDRIINHNAEEIFVVEDSGDTKLEVGSKVTQIELDKANKDKENPAVAPRMKTLVQSFGGITEKEMAGFVIYGMALRATTMHQRGIQSGMDVADLQHVLDTKENLGYRPEWDQAWKDITEWHGVLLDWLVDAGRLSDDMRTLFKEANPVYLPFKRAYVDDALNKGTGGNIMTPSALKRMKGSYKELSNPIDAMQEHATSMIALAIKSRITTAIADVTPLNGIGDMIAKVPAKARSMNALIGPLKGQLKTIMSNTLEEQDMDQVTAQNVSDGLDALIGNIDDAEMLKVFYRDNTWSGTKDNPVVPIFRNGEIQLYEVDKELFQVIQETTKFETDIAGLKAVLKLLRPFASMARIGWTGLNVKFNLWTNPMRDIPLAAIYTKGKATPFRFVKGIVTSAKNWASDDLFNIKGGEWSMSRRYQGGGGNVATINGMEQSLWQAQHGQLNWKRKGVNKTAMILKNPLKGASTFMQGVHGFLSTTELGPRVAEFESVYDQTQTIQSKAQDKKKRNEVLTKKELEHLDWTEEDHYINAKVAAKDITFNFTKTGKWGKLINQAWPFHNATMQGPNKAYRAFKEHPTKMLYRSLVAITLPAMVSWYMSKDEEWYKNIQNTYNDLNLFFNVDHFPVMRETLIAAGIDPKNKILVMPIPHETGILFGSIPRAFLDEIFLKREGAIWDAVKSAIEMVIPSFVKDVATGKGFQPAMTAPWHQVKTNESHFGRPIVPPYMMNSFSPKLPEDQVYPWTSRLSRVFSKILVDMSKATKTETFKFNPIQLDHMFKQYTGGLGTQGITLVEDAIFGTKSGRSPLSVTLRMPHRPSRQIELFYLEYNELSGLKGGEKASKKQLKRLKAMKDFKSDVLDGLNKQKKKIGIPSGDKDLEKMRNIHKKMANKLNKFLGSKHEDLK